METLEFYRLKDELSELVKSEVARSVASERDLQQRYVGLGLKIAAGGLGAAVLALGIFGVKSLNDINTAIAKIPEFITTRTDAEIAKRFDENNPIVKYETMLLESSARAIVASLSAQLERTGALSIDERTADITARSLQHKDVRSSTKLSLIRTFSTTKIRNVSPAIDQAIATFAQQLANESKFDERALISCMRYFGQRNAERFISDVEKLYDLRGNVPGIGIATSRYALELSKGYGNDLFKKLEKSDDLGMKYIVHIANLKASKTSQLDTALFKSMLSSAVKEDTSEDVNLTEVIKHIVSVAEASNNTSELPRQIVNSLREHMAQAGLSPTLRFQSADNTYFAFASIDGENRSASIGRESFESLLEIVSSQIREEFIASGGKVTDQLKEKISFWLPRSSIDAAEDDERASFFLIRDAKNLRFVLEDGSEIEGKILNGQANIVPRVKDSQTRLVLRWADAVEGVKSVPIAAIRNLRMQSLRLHGTWKNAQIDSGLSFSR